MLPPGALLSVELRFLDGVRQLPGQALLFQTTDISTVELMRRLVGLRETWQAEQRVYMYR
jgi:hypothetical protein